MGDLDGALTLLGEASPLIDSEREPRLMLCAQHNLVDFLSKAGRPAEARALLPKVRAISRELGNDLDLVRLTWTEARIAGDLGEAGEAERLFLAARDAFMAKGIGYDVALVSLELAALYAREERFAEVREVARVLMPVFEAQDVHREALAALRAFTHAALHDRVSAELLGRLSAFLVMARGNPDLRFEEE
jgi:hypothetical protein